MFTRRSWGTFGAAIMGLGIAIIFIVVLVSSVNAQVSIVSILVGVAGLAIAFVGVKISSWDKWEDAGMLWVDPNLDYHFFLTFRGAEQEITDFSRVEEALNEFDKHREAWKLRIVPPMGTLFEWEGYYDEKQKTYVTEIAYVREEGIQKWVRRSDYDGMVKLNQTDLKKIMVQKKKAELLLFCRIK